MSLIMSDMEVETPIQVPSPTTLIKRERSSSLTIFEAEEEVKKTFQSPTYKQNNNSKIKRKRNVKSALRACDYCQYRKIRCNRNDPNDETKGRGEEGDGCYACVTRGISCTFLNPTKRNQKLSEPTTQLRSDKIKYVRPRINSKKEKKQRRGNKATKKRLGDSPKSDIVCKVDNNSSAVDCSESLGEEARFPTNLNCCISNYYLDKDSQLHNYILGLVELRNLTFKDVEPTHTNIITNFYKFVYPSLPSLFSTELNLNTNGILDTNDLTNFQNPKLIFNLNFLQILLKEADTSFLHFVLNLMATSLGILIELYTFDGSPCNELTIKYYDLSTNQLYIIFDDSNNSFKDHCLNLLDLLAVWAKLLIDNGSMF